MNTLIPMETEPPILLVRGQRVLLDSDLAQLYCVTTKRLNEQVKRNRARFPADFIFEIDAGEWADLRSQIATSSWGGRRTLPMAFTEHGAIMVASVLNSSQAVEASVYVVRTEASNRICSAGPERRLTIQGSQRAAAAVFQSASRPA
jgi:hypothetical protein